MWLLLAGAMVMAEPVQCNGPSSATTAEYSWPARLEKGYYPVRVDIENRGPEEQEFTLRFESTYGYQVHIEQVVPLARGERRQVEVLLPAFVDASPNYSLQVMQENGISDCYSSAVGPYDVARGSQVVLLVQDRSPEPGDLERWVSDLDISEDQMAIISPEQLALSWGAYSSVDLVLVDTRAGLPSDAALAPLMRWVRTGGVIVFRGPGVKTLAQSREQLSPYAQERHLLRPTVQQRLVLGLDGFAVGGGVMVLQEEEMAADRLLESASLVARDVPQQRWIPDSTSTFRVARPQIPGVGVIPSGSFALLLFGVGVLLGPINVVLIRALKRSAGMLVTTPILATLSAGGILAYGVASTGLGAQSASYSVTYLDQAAQTATVQEVRQIYLGAAIAGGLRPGAGFYDFPSRLDYDESFKVRIDDEGRRVSGALLPSRVATTQVLVGERSSRLNLSVSGGEISNNLDARLDRVVLRAADGSYWGLNAPLKAGKSATLVPMDNPDEQLAVVWASTMALGGAGYQYPAVYQDMAPGSYVARLERSPFLDDEGLKMDERAGEHRVIGLLELP